MTPPMLVAEGSLPPPLRLRSNVCVSSRFDYTHVLIESHSDGALRHTDKVTALLASVSIPQMQSYLAQLTSYTNRYYRATTGATSSNWIYSTMLDVRYYLSS